VHRGLHTILCLGLVVALPCSGQEGFPLDGTWRGEHGVDAENRAPVVIVMTWDGESITGLINPGPKSMPFTSAMFNPSDWTVHIEADDANGEPVVIDALLEDIGSYHRTLTGTWREAGTERAFKVARE
jgi:hypothetical protein